MDVVLAVKHPQIWAIYIFYVVWIRYTVIATFHCHNICIQEVSPY